MHFSNIFPSLVWRLWLQIQSCLRIRIWICIRIRLRRPGSEIIISDPKLQLRIRNHNFGSEIIISDPKPQFRIRPWHATPSKQATRTDWTVVRNSALMNVSLSTVISQLTHHTMHNCSYNKCLSVVFSSFWHLLMTSYIRDSRPPQACVYLWLLKFDILQRSCS